MYQDRPGLGLKLASEGDLSGAVRVEAFRQLLASGFPVEVDSLASSMACPLGIVVSALDELDRAGRIRRDDRGRVIGSAGLSVAPDRHRIELDGRTFWTWCAYDILGIFGASRATGSAFSRSPATGKAIQVRFRDGRPKMEGVVLFRPSDSYADCCTNIYEEWCPNSNLFEDQESAESWSTRRGLKGRILSLEEASELAMGEWLPLFKEAQPRLVASTPGTARQTGQVVEVELLSVAGCPHVDAARQLLNACVEELQIRAHIEEKVGAYPSPTIRVDGRDVMGSPPVFEAACRLDRPTRERVLAALQRKVGETS